MRIQVAFNKIYLFNCPLNVVFSNTSWFSQYFCGSQMVSLHMLLYAEAKGFHIALTFSSLDVLLLQQC